MPRLLWSGSSWRGGPAGRASARLSNKLFPVLLTVDAAAHLLSAVLEYQPVLAPRLCCFRLQRVIFNPSIQSVSRNRRRNIQHMLTSAPRRCGGARPSSCWGNPCPSVHDRVRKVCSQCLGVRGPTASWATARHVQCRGDRKRDSILSQVSFRLTGSRAQHAQRHKAIPQQSHWARGFRDTGASGVQQLVGLRTQHFTKEGLWRDPGWMQLWLQST